MTFPVDIIWICGNRVVQITPYVESPGPGTLDIELTLYRASVRSDKVVEVPAGWAAAAGIKLGDHASIGSLRNATSRRMPST